MKEVPGLILAPFTGDQVKSINRFQSDGRLQPITCGCGKKMYAREEGMLCSMCFSSQDYAPKLTTNWAWTMLKYPTEEEKDGIN